MTNPSNPEQSKPEIEWELQECFMGAGEWVIFRRSGERVQYRTEMPLLVTRGQSDTHYDAPAFGLGEFLAKCEDTIIRLRPARATDKGDVIPPTLTVIGWKDLAPEDRHYYDEAVAARWKHPDENWQQVD